MDGERIEMVERGRDLMGDILEDIEVVINCSGDFMRPYG